MENKVVIITGASSGIGAAVAVHFCKIGYRKLALVARREQRLQEVKAQCLAAGGTDILLVVKDLSDPKNSESVITETVGHFGRLDSVFSNAGILRPMMTRDLTLESIIELQNVNLVSQMMLTKYALPHLEKTKGTIVFNSSTVAHMNLQTFSNYQASKAAISHFARTVALEEAPKGIRVNCINPGFVVTEIIEPLPEEKGKSNAQMDELAQKTFDMNVMTRNVPMGRNGTVEEASKLIAFVMSDDNSFMTGSDVIFDGGMRICPPNSTPGHWTK